MTNAFQILGLPPSLILSDEVLRDAYREAGKLAHPDAGGGDGEFSELLGAWQELASPSRRLRLWLQMKGTPAELRGTVDSGLMDLFATIGGVNQRAENVIRRRQEAKSALVHALLEGETQQSRDEVEKMIAEVDRVIAETCGHFPHLEEYPASPEAPAVARKLAFLEKWRAGLRAAFAQLV